LEKKESRKDNRICGKNEKGSRRSRNSVEKSIGENEEASK